MAVNATEVLYLTSGLFKAVPSKAILTDLVKFNGNIDQLAATLGTSEFAINAFPFSNAEKAKLLAENLLGSTVADKAAAVTALEGILNANGGNVGIAAAAGIRAILTDAAFADAKAQLENRVEVAKNYVDSNKGNEISTSILDAVTKDAATVTTAINSLTGTTGGNEAGVSRVLTTGQDVFTGTAGDDNFRAVAGVQEGSQDQTTLNSSDNIDGATGNDTLIVNMTGTNYAGGARIKNIETLQIGTNLNAAVTFDYNINQGQNEITDVTTIVADQINTGETLTIRNLVRDAADKALPTLSWINDSTAVNGLAGTVNAAYRAAAVSGTDDEQAINLTNVRAGTLNINAGIEKAVVASTGSSTNSIRAIDSITGTNTTLKEVVINAEATAALGEGRIISTAAGTRGLEVARTPANDNAQHVSFVNVGSAVTKVDASGSKGNVNVAFTDTATAVANTFIGGEGNDQVVVNGGNDNLSGGKGNDTFIFNQTNTSANGTFFNNSDTLDGGEGTDTIQIDYAGTAALGQVVIQTSEWLNSKGLDALDLRAQNTRVQLDDAFVGRADAGSFEVITNKIVQNDSTTSVADEASSRHQIDLTTVTASRAVKVTGGEGRETVIVTDALNGVQTISGGNGLDALVVQNGATLTGQDLQNVSGINVFNLVKTSANAQSFQIDLTADFLTKAIDANAAAGTSKNTANAFRIVTDTTDTNAATISGVQTLAAGDSVTITVDATDLTTVDAINIRDLIASNATITVRNTAGTTLLAAANGAVTTNTGIFAGVTGSNYTYTDLTTNPIAGVGSPVHSGQASTGGGGAAPVAGNTFTLTAAGGILTSTVNSGGVSPSGSFLTTGSDTITGINTAAGGVLSGTVLQDASTTDADVANFTISVNPTTAPIMANIETINATLYGTTLDSTNISGTNTYAVSGTGVATLSNLASGKTVTLNSASQGLTASTLAVGSNTDTLSLTLNGIAAGTWTNGTGANTNDFDQVTLTSGGSAANSITLATTGFNNNTTDLLTVTGTQDLNLTTSTALATGSYINATGLATPVFTLTISDDATGINYANMSGIDRTNFTVAAGLQSGNDAFTGVANGQAFTLTPTNATVTHGTLSFTGNTAATTATADAITLTLAGTTVGTGVITTTNLETLNLVSSGSGATTVAGVTMTASPLSESLVITGGTALTLTDATADVINASGLTAAFTMTNAPTAAAGAQITGSSTASNVLMGSAQADIITGGAANDTITGGGGNDTITISSGGADVIRIATANAADAVTGFTAGTGTGADVLDINEAFVSNNNTAVDLAGYGTTKSAAAANFLNNMDNLTIASATGYAAGTSVILEIGSGLGTLAQLTAADFRAKFGVGGSAGALTVGTNDQGKFLVVAYNGTTATADAAVFLVDYSTNLGGNATIAAGDTVTLIGTFTGVGANNFDAANFL